MFGYSLSEAGKAIAYGPTHLRVFREGFARSLWHAACHTVPIAQQMMWRGKKQQLLVFRHRRRMLVSGLQRRVLLTSGTLGNTFNAHRKAFHQTTLEAGSDVRVRDAANEDYHHVLAIKSDIYWGRDYLPWRYHAILASPLYRTAVCQHKDAIVGFAAAKVVDEGSTLVLTSGRVSDRLQGQGLVKLMVDHLHRALRDEGRLAREAITTKGDNKQLQWRSLNQDYQHVLQRAVHSFYFDIRLVKIPAAPYCSVSAVSAASCRQTQLLEAAMLSPSSQRLFPQQRVIVNWLPYRLLKGNVAHITENSFLTASQEPADKPVTRAGGECYESSANHRAAKQHPELTEDATVSHVTIGSFFPCNLGLAYNVDMYGDWQNEATVTRHLSQHLQRLQHLTSATVHLLLFTDCGVEEVTLDRCLRQLGVCRRHWPQTAVHLFERPCPRNQ